MDANKRFAELAGLCWHDFIESMQTDYGYCRYCRKHRQEVEPNPDYADAREVLKVMYNTEEYGPFLIYLWGTQHIQANDVLAVASVPLFYVLDTTGKLRDLAISWMEEGGRR